MSGSTSASYVLDISTSRMVIARIGAGGPVLHPSRPGAATVSRSTVCPVGSDRGARHTACCSSSQNGDQEPGQVEYSCVRGADMAFFRSDTRVFQPETAIFRSDTRVFWPYTAVFRSDTCIFCPYTAIFRSDTLFFQPDRAILRARRGQLAKSRGCTNLRVVS
ncbi:hypothetical protein LCGC14_1634480 [marine sediment metagenome]|uniref:Uncharacterized protein n=1 Tax=marine sediment metagenome TaxID=412755 RepID=A0A0F9L1B4_9ZZZZ